MSTSTQTTSSNQTATPTNQSYINTGLNAAQGALSTAQTGATPLPTQLTAGMTPQQLAAFKTQAAYGMTAPNATELTNTGGALSSAGETGSGLSEAQLAGYSPNTYNGTSGVLNSANAYMSGFNVPAQVQQAMLAGTQEAQQVTMPAIASSAAGTGNINSTGTANEGGLVQQGLAEQAASLSGQLSSQDYASALGTAESQGATNANAALNAASNLGTVSNNAAGLGLGALTNAPTVAGTQYTIANTGLAAPQQNTQLADQNASQMYTQSQTAPFEASQMYMPIASVNDGGTTTGQSTTQTTPSALQTIGGLVSGASSLLGSAPVYNPSTGTTSGGSGVLGAYNMFGTPSYASYSTPTTSSGQIY